ncbi:hypothetical protein BC629DRAFT_1566152, partial [Irpex lacteus]
MIMHGYAIEAALRDAPVFARARLPGLPQDRAFLMDTQVLSGVERLTINDATIEEVVDIELEEDTSSEEDSSSDESIDIDPYEGASVVDSIDCFLAEPDAAGILHPPAWMDHDSVMASPTSPLCPTPGSCTYDEKIAVLSRPPLLPGEAIAEDPPSPYDEGYTSRPWVTPPRVCPPSRCTHTAHHVISTLIAFKDVINAQEFQEDDRTRRRRRFSAPNSEIAAMYATDGNDSDGLVVHWLARRALVRRLRPIIELAQDLGLERFLRTFRNLDPEDHAELQLALTALFFPKQEFDGNPYLDPVEEIEALQARVFFAISNQYHGYVAETLDNALAYRASTPDNDTIQGYRRRGIFGGHWSVPTFPQDFRDICLETFQRA